MASLTDTCPAEIYPSSANAELDTTFGSQPDVDAAARRAAQPDVDATARRAAWFAYSANGNAPLLPLSKFSAQYLFVSLPAGQPDVDGAVCLFCIQQYAVFTPVSVFA